MSTHLAPMTRISERDGISRRSRGRPLSAEHTALLRASGLSADVIAAWGYWTATPDDATLMVDLGHSRKLVEHGDCLMLPAHDVHGQTPYTIARPDRPRLDNQGRPKKYELPRGAQVTLDVPPLVRPALADPEIALWITEGQKKGDAAVAAGANAVIVLHRVWAWKKSALTAWDAVALRERTVYLAFDSDAHRNNQVCLALCRLRAFLKSRGAHVLVVHLEDGPNGEKVGLDDALAAGQTLDQLAAGATDRILEPAVAPNDKRPVLDVTTVHLGTVTAAWPHLRGVVYRFDRLLVRAEDSPHGPTLHPLGVEQLRAFLDTRVRCVRQGDRKEFPVLPPKDLASRLLNDPDPPLARIRAVATAPVFTTDGRRLATDGFDAGSGTLVRLAFPPAPVPTAPTDDEVTAARRLLDEELLGDFPFAGASDCTHALALALTPMVRDLIDGPTPLFGIEAPLRGAGKGKLATACLTPALGPGGWATVPYPEDGGELRKAITAHLVTARSAILFDNVGRSIRQPVLAQALTSHPFWEDRRLGATETIRLPVRNVWAYTANNPDLSDEIARRVVPIRLEPPTDRPELREGFRHADLEAWARAHRPALVAALCTLVQAWLAAGRPARAVNLGSFESWCRVVGGILTVAGYEGFLGNREAILTAAEPDTAAWADFTAAWFDQHADRYVLVSELLSLAEQYQIRVSGETERARVTSLGTQLRHRRGRLFGGLKVEQGTERRTRRAWRVVEQPASNRASLDTLDTSLPNLDGRARARDDAGQSAGLPEQVSKVSEVSEVSTRASAEVSGVVAMGALVRVRLAPGRVIVETRDGSLVLASVAGELHDPQTHTALVEELGRGRYNGQRADDLRRLFAGMEAAA